MRFRICPERDANEVHSNAVSTIIEYPDGFIIRLMDGYYLKSSGANMER
jgi:hypothetical protein